MLRNFFGEPIIESLEDLYNCEEIQYATEVLAANAFKSDDIEGMYEAEIVNAFTGDIVALVSPMDSGDITYLLQQCTNDFYFDD